MSSSGAAASSAAKACLVTASEKWCCDRGTARARSHLQARVRAQLLQRVAEPHGCVRGPAIGLGRTHDRREVRACGMLCRAPHASAAQRHGQPQLQQRMLCEEDTHAVLQRLLDCTVKLSDSLLRKAGRHGSQQVHHAAEGGAQPDQHVYHLRVV